jgi:hypothetical protein
MRRIQVMLAIVAAVATTVVMSAPVMAQGFIGTNDVCVDAFGRLVFCGFNDGLDGVGGVGGDINLAGSSINMSPTLDNNVTQMISQSAAG